MSDAHAALREPWESLHRQKEAATFGMWVFLASELLFFGGLFVTYAYYRTLYPDGFWSAARETSIVYGTVNTAIMLTSSLTVAAASEASVLGARRAALWCLGLTVLLATAFLTLKGFEYAEDVGKQLVPGPDFRLTLAGSQIFFALYWAMTALHGVHVSIGIGLLGVMWWQLWRNTRPPQSPAIETAALYWGFVDLVWIFLYPLIYLPGRL